MDKIKKNNEQVISIMEKAIALRHKEINRYQKIIDTLKKDIVNKDIGFKEVSYYVKSTRITLEAYMFKFFDDGVPKLARELYSLYTEKKGMVVTFRGFSGQLSTLIKTKGTISNCLIKGDRRSLYGLSEWFKNGEIIDKYRKNIKAK